MPVSTTQNRKVSLVILNETASLLDRIKNLDSANRPYYIYVDKALKAYYNIDGSERISRV